MININDNTTTAGDSQAEQPITAEVDSQNSEATITEDSNEQPELSEATDAQGQSEEDSFFDPNSVPDELKPAYKQMQAAFTKKTQEIAEERKMAEAFKQKAEAYEKVQQFIPLIEEMQSSQGTQQSPEMAALEQNLRAQGYNDDAIEMMKVGVGFALNQVNQTREVEKISNGITDAGKLDQRLNDTSLVYQVDGENVTYGQIVEKYVAADPNWRKDPVLATQKAIRLVDTLINQGKSEGKKELSASARSKANKFPTTNSSSQSTVNESQPLTIKEAYEQAKAEKAF